MARSSRAAPAVVAQSKAPARAKTSAVCIGDASTSSRYARSPVVRYSSAAAQ